MVHDVAVVIPTSTRQIASIEHNDSVQALSIVAWRKPEIG